MKKTYQRLPESELDIMLVLWNNTPPMTRPEIEKVINMKKKFWLTLYNIGVSILFLLSLYSYAKGMAGFSLFLALAVFGEIAARAFIECKYLQESPEIKEDTAYRITKVLRLLSEIILIIGVWRIRFK